MVKPPRTPDARCMITTDEDPEPVSSPGGWTLTSTLHQVLKTPGGSRRVLQSQCYNWKAGATDESEDLRKKRMDVKRKARQAAEDKFDENKVASKNERRRKRYAEQKAAPATPAALNAEGMGGLQLAAPPPQEPEPEPEKGPSLATRRDLALLSCWMLAADPEAALLKLRESGLDDEDEPWTVQHVAERAVDMRRCLRETYRLLGPQPSVSKVRSLRYMSM